MEDVLTKGDPEEAMIERIALREAIGALAQRERLVIELRYFRAMTQEQVARVLQVSQVQGLEDREKGRHESARAAAK